MSYPKEYLLVGIKYVTVLQNKAQFVEAFESTRKCLDFIDIIKIRIQSDPMAADQYKQSKMFKIEHEFLTLQLKNAHGLQKIDLKLQLIEQLASDVEEIKEEQVQEYKLRLLLYHAL